MQIKNHSQNLRILEQKFETKSILKKQHQGNSSKKTYILKTTLGQQNVQGKNTYFFFVKIRDGITL